MASVDIIITGNDEVPSLPIAVQNAFNLTGTNLAVGKQLDILGKYAGVTRTGNGFTGSITLDDADFRSLIKLAIITNSSGSDLSTIETLLNEFFPNGEILVFDYKNMRLSYIISSAVGSQDLVQLFITEGLLPKPMGVQLSTVIYVPDTKNFFGFRTYSAPANNAKPFNTYSNFSLLWRWLTYQDGVGV